MMMKFFSRSTSPFITFSLITMIICCAIITPHLQTASAAGFFAKKVVHIYDRIPNNNTIQPQTPLLVHCKSKSDDLGTWTMAEGSDHRISFRVNWIGTTLFWCHFVWGSKYQDFTVYDADHDAYPFDVNINWYVKENGFFRSGGGNPNNVTNNKEEL
ncbi:hypothetical protein DM860_002478 [Cuscuta australis]|uniref:S-protein homolog n=1 Tax=Cuscuta australis TaxID=267555 RepID=A0A328D0L8_9ASTE|nr:hypothetical protein DM860_002478 [Cuscuta australis]